MFKNSIIKYLKQIVLKLILIYIYKYCPSLIPLFIKVKVKRIMKNKQIMKIGQNFMQISLAKLRKFKQLKIAHFTQP